MTVPLLVTADSVRGLLNLTEDATSRYSSGTIGSNIRTSLEFLEQASGRYFYDRPAITLNLTTNGQASIALPGFRSITSLTWSGTALAVNDTYWTYPDELGTGLIMAVSVRQTDRSSYLANSEWFDRDLDKYWRAGWDPGLMGDLVIVGNGGYAAGTEPIALLDAIRIMAAWKTKRSDSLFSGGFTTADGNIFDLSELPVEVQRFVKLWRFGGTQAVSL